MNRKLILLKNPGIKASDGNYAPGVNIAIERYKSFFKSPIGGAWDDNEIIEINNSEFDLKTAVKNLLNDFDKQHIDYSIIVFVGHGANENSKDIIQLEDSQSITIDELKYPQNESLKRLIIVDACRSFTQATMLEQRIDESKEYTSYKPLNRAQCRELYDSIIEECEPHVEIIQSTQIGTYAKSHKDGTVFTDAFIETLLKEGYCDKMKTLMDYMSDESVTYQDISISVEEKMKPYNQRPEFTVQPHVDHLYPLIAIRRLAKLFR
jgi:hypothetical protein